MLVIDKNKSNEKKQVIKKDKDISKTSNVKKSLEQLRSLDEKLGRSYFNSKRVSLSLDNVKKANAAIKKVSDVK